MAREEHVDIQEAEGSPQGSAPDATDQQADEQSELSNTGPTSTPQADNEQTATEAEVSSDLIIYKRRFISLIREILQDMGKEDLQLQIAACDLLQGATEDFVSSLFKGAKLKAEIEGRKEVKKEDIEATREGLNAAGFSC